jgi:hypothetical protein
MKRAATSGPERDRQQQERLKVQKTIHRAKLGAVDPNVPRIRKPVKSGKIPIPQTKPQKARVETHAKFVSCTSTTNTAIQQPPKQPATTLRVTNSKIKPKSKTEVQSKVQSQDRPLQPYMEWLSSTETPACAPQASKVESFPRARKQKTKPLDPYMEWVLSSETAVRHHKADNLVANDVAQSSSGQQKKSSTNGPSSSKSTRIQEELQELAHEIRQTTEATQKRCKRMADKLDEARATTETQQKKKVAKIGLTSTPAMNASHWHHVARFSAGFAEDASASDGEW